MNNIIKQTINDIIEYLKLSQSGASDKEINLLCIEIKSDFKLLEQNKLIDELYIYVRNEFIDDYEMQIYLLSIIYAITLEEHSLIEVFNILCKDEIDLLTRMCIRTQVEINIFRNNNISRNYQLRRIVQKNIVDQFEKLLDLNMPYKQLKDRNKNRIVIVTNQLLGDLHAPTNITKEICYILQEKLGFEVILIVSYENMDDINLDDIWHNSSRLFYYSECTGNFTTERYGSIISGYQLVMNENNYINETKQIIRELYNFNPLCVWYMGACASFADLFLKYTTVLAMPFTNGYAISDANIMVSYLDSQSDEIKDMELYINQQNQCTLKYDLDMPIRPSENTYDRVDFGINDNDFIITIVGNRLDHEITETFLVLLKRVLMIEQRIVIVFIGVFNEYESILKDEIFIGRTKYLGFQEDLVGVLSIMDLFLNPPRQGGGAGAIYALYNGVPVVTLDNCDVGNCINKDDTCSNEEEILDQIVRYVTDAKYYEVQSEKAKMTQSMRNIDKMTLDTKILLDKVMELSV